LVRTDTGAISKWATSDLLVTSLVRDLFDGSIYVAQNGPNNVPNSSTNPILKYDEKGASTLFQMSANPARLSIAPNGWLYAVGYVKASAQSSVERWQLPMKPAQAL